jgi:hypothetical protein
MGAFPRGTIVQTERGHAHKKFVEAVKPNYVLIKINYARMLLKAGITASDRFPESTAVITTTSIRDSQNAALPLEKSDHRRTELDIVREFQPDFHIPADEADYRDYPDEKRYDRVHDCMTGTLTMANHVADGDLDIQILPWVKGVTEQERKLTYRTVEQLGMDYMVFYANGYFNGNDGNWRRQLVEDLELITEEATEEMTHTDEIEICVLNCQSPNLLARMPDEVVASSGLWVGQNRGWRRKVTPTTQDEEEVREIYNDVDERVRESLGLEDQTTTKDEQGHAPPGKSVSEQ